MPRQLTREQLDEAASAYRSGSTYAALACRFQMSETRLRKQLRGMVEPRRPGKQLIEVPAPELALADWQAGLSCRQIADKHGLPGGCQAPRHDRRPLSRAGGAHTPEWPGKTETDRGTGPIHDGRTPVSTCKTAIC
jgi:hypothetical protein